jgi:hypothetical protein
MSSGVCLGANRLPLCASSRRRQAKTRKPAACRVGWDYDLWRMGRRGGETPVPRPCCARSRKSCGDARPTKSAPDALGRASVPARLTEPSAATKISRTRRVGGWPAESSRGANGEPWKFLMEVLLASSVGNTETSPGTPSGRRTGRGRGRTRTRAVQGCRSVWDGTREKEI